MQATDLTATRPEQKAFAEREYVDMPRACRILGISWNMVVGMVDNGYLRLVDYRPNAHKRIHYETLVEHCNRLRGEYAIPDRRPPLGGERLRHRDEDILPFPFCDTITVADAVPMLGYSAKWTTIKLCVEGRFESYRLHPGAPWRISRSSLLAYLERITQGVHGDSEISRTNSAHSGHGARVNRENRAMAAVTGGSND